MEAIEVTRKRWSDFVQTLGLPFTLFPMAEKEGNLDLERLNGARGRLLPLASQISPTIFPNTYKAPCDEEEMGKDASITL
ncbi:hypothetical protein MRB53_034974 [Persea americana]|uniref:Uncharacterized protein n=1 Tax=Persea americana TaxID=3435 RepID=A0ACC2K3U9_PERAE|nr:hypothetical protein MRB53_034974 [Persea americana]